MLQKLKKIWNNYFHKSFIIDFSFSEINEKKIVWDKECFEEFLKMFKNDFIKRLWDKDYKWAEVIKGIIERLITMYSDYFEKENKDDKTKPIDIITKLQEKMKAEWEKTWQ